MKQAAKVNAICQTERPRSLRCDTKRLQVRLRTPSTNIVITCAGTSLELCLFCTLASESRTRRARGSVAGGQALPLPVHRPERPPSPRTQPLARRVRYVPQLPSQTVRRRARRRPSAAVQRTHLADRVPHPRRQRRLPYLPPRLPG